VPHQRGVFHTLKTLGDALEFQGRELDPTLPRAEAKRQAKRARRQAMLAEASQISAAEEEAKIQGRAVAFRRRWEAVEPKAVTTFFTDFDKPLNSLRIDFPRAYVSLIRTTNLLERFHREVRRKQRDIGMFQSERGCEVVVYLVATRETAKQRAARRRR